MPAADGTQGKLARVQHALAADDRAALARAMTPDDDAEAHLARGRGFAGRALWSDAIAELAQAHDLAPERTDIALELASAHHRRAGADDRRRADRLAREVLQREPSHDAAFALLADLDADRRARVRRTWWLVAGAAALLSALALALSAPLPAALALAAAATATFCARRTPARPTPRALPSSPSPSRPSPGPPRAASPRVPPAGRLPSLSADGGILELVPGHGLAATPIGVATPDAVLAHFGADARVHRYDSGEVFWISYDYDETGDYQPSRRHNRRRPEGFRFDRGVLSEIAVGVYNDEVRTPGGLTPDGSVLADVLQEFGDDHVYSRGEGPLDEYDYPRLGIRVWVHRESERVNSFKIEARKP